MNRSALPPCPKNHMAMAVISTIFCCLPFGIVGIIKASKVNGLYLTKQYEAATLMAQDAKKWSIIGIITGLVIQVIYVIFYGATLASQL